MGAGFHSGSPGRRVGRVRHQLYQRPIGGIGRGQAEIDAGRGHDKAVVPIGGHRLQRAVGAGDAGQVEEGIVVRLLAIRVAAGLAGEADAHVRNARGMIVGRAVAGVLLAFDAGNLQHRHIGGRDQIAIGVVDVLRGRVPGADLDDAAAAVGLAPGAQIHRIRSGLEDVRGGDDAGRTGVHQEGRRGGAIAESEIDRRRVARHRTACPVVIGHEDAVAAIQQIGGLRRARHGRRAADNDRHQRQPEAAPRFECHYAPSPTACVPGNTLPKSKRQARILGRH